MRNMTRQMLSCFTGKRIWRKYIFNFHGNNITTVNVGETGFIWNTTRDETNLWRMCVIHLRWVWFTEILTAALTVANSITALPAFLLEIKMFNTSPYWKTHNIQVNTVQISQRDARELLFSTFPSCLTYFYCPPSALRASLFLYGPWESLDGVLE